MAVVSLAGCEGMFMAGQGGTSAQSSRQTTASETPGAKQEVLIDFETDQDLQLCRTVSVSGRAYCARTNRRAVSETGSYSLEFTLGAGRDELVIDETNAAQAALQRNWQDYDVLRLQVYSDRDVKHLRLIIRGGNKGTLSYVKEPIHLHEGWNRLRIDLYEVGQFLPLDEISTLRLSCPGVLNDLTLYLDDVVLESNREGLFGDWNGDDGRMFVLRQGRRLRVGAAKRYELVFAHGQVVQWFDLEYDPSRIRDLLMDGPLGPSPIILPANYDDDQDAEQSPDWADLGSRVVARQAVVEASDIRVVMDCYWTFIDGPGQPLGNEPFHRWRYVLYPSGKVFVNIACSVRKGAWRAGHVGMAVCCRPRTGLQVLAHRSGLLDDPPDLVHVTYGAAWNRSPRQPDLLFVVSDSRSAPLIRRKDFADGSKLGLVTSSSGSADADVLEWAVMLNLWPSTIAEEQFAQRALDYCYPANDFVEIGRLISGNPGDLDEDGYNESEGVYEVAPEGLAVRLRLSGEKYRRFRPAVRIADSAGLSAWVYANGEIVRDVGRDTNDQIIFEIPNEWDDQMIVEAYLGK